MRKLLAITLGVALAGVGTVALAARNASGTHVLPASNPVIPGTRITSAWANALTSDLSAEITNSLARDGKGGMTASLRGVSGSVSAPSFAFTADTDTGLYLQAAGNLRAAVAGADALVCTATGVSVPGTLAVTGAATAATGLTVTSGGLDLKGGSLTLSEGVAQSIAKTGGTLIISAAGANEVQVWTNGAQAVTAQADGDLYMHSHKIQALATPVDADDAATKGYADSVVPAANRTICAGKFGGVTATLAAGSVGLSALARLGGAPAGRYTVTCAGATSNSIVLITPGNNGLLATGLVLAAGVSGTTVSIDSRDNTGTLIDVAEIAVSVIKGS